MPHAAPNIIIGYRPLSLLEADQAASPCNGWLQSDESPRVECRSLLPITQATDGRKGLSHGHPSCGQLHDIPTLSSGAVWIPRLLVRVDRSGAALIVPIDVGSSPPYRLLSPAPIRS
jgi:hypothetical protein